MELEKAFTRLREARVRLEALPSRDSSRARARSSGSDGGVELPKKEEHMVYASDLVLTLGVSEAEAEEMIFIADLQDNQAIDFTEFKQVVVNWS